MERYRSDPIGLTPAAIAGQFKRADLVFYGVDHSGPSFEALVFIDAPAADVDTPLQLAAGFAGSFVIFGHGGCYGDEGHCHVPQGPRDPFDSRPPHGLTPQTKMVEITEALRARAGGGETVTVTALAIVPGRERPELRDVLHFSGLRLLTFG